MSTEDYGIWQSVAPQQIDETFLAFPPPSAQSPRQEESDEDVDGMDEEEVAPLQSSSEQSQLTNTVIPSGLPPRPSSGSMSSFSGKRLIDRKKITPPEYYSTDYIEKLRIRSAEWAKHDRKTCGTQTGVTPPPTPPMRPTPHPLAGLVDHSLVESDNKGEEVEAYQMEPLDILYQSAQLLHVMGEALTVLFFMDVNEQAAVAIVPSTQPVFRVPSALSSRRISRPSSSSVKQLKVKSSPLIQAMHDKMMLLEQECAIFQVENCAIDESRLRAMTMAEQETVRSRLIQEEDSDKLVIQEQLRSCHKPAAPSLPSQGLSTMASGESDAELHQLRLAARAYMKGGAKQLRPPIPAAGFSETFMRRAKSSKSGLPPIHNTASALLRSLQAELAELEPVAAPKKSLLPPLLSAAAPTPSSSLAQRVSSAGFRERPASPGLPHLQKTLLTAATLPPIVASVLPDRDFSRAALTLPPLTGGHHTSLRTPIGLITPGVAHSAVEIARLKQEAESEITHATYTRGDDKTARAFAAARRPFSAATNPTMPEALPVSLERATQRSHHVVVIQSQLRALGSRGVTCERAMMKVLQWLQRMLRRIYRRRVALKTQHLSVKNKRLLLTRYFAIFRSYSNEHAQLREVARACLMDKLSVVVDRRNVCASLSNLRRKDLLTRYWRSLLSFRASRRMSRHVASLGEGCRRNATVRYFETWYQWLLLSKPESKRIYNQSRLRAIRQQANHKMRLQFFAKFERLYIRAAHRKEARCRLQLLIEERRRQVVSDECTRVWCVTMISSGWARKYFKPFFYELLRRVNDKKNLVKGRPVPSAL
jgi:hypothetical protein